MDSNMVITRHRLRQIIKEEVSTLREAISDLGTPDKLGLGGGSVSSASKSKKGASSKSSSPLKLYKKILSDFKKKKINVTESAREFQEWASGNKSKWKHASSRTIRKHIKRWMIAQGHATSEQFIELVKEGSSKTITETDSDASGDLSPDELRDLADDLEGEPLTGQALRDALISDISDMHKDIYGMRPRAEFNKMTTEELEKMHDKVNQTHKDWWYEERHREDQDMWIADEERETEELMDPEEGEDMPKHMGMGRGKVREMKITHTQLRQIIKEELTRVDEAWTSFNDAIVKSLDPDMEGKKVYYFDPKSDLVHTLISGKVSGKSEKAPHGSRLYLNYKRAAKGDPSAYFNFTTEEEGLAESYDTNSDGNLDPGELRRIASELEGDKPLVKRGGRHERISGYTYDNVTGVHVRNDYNPRTDYGGTLDKVLTQMGIKY
jgi:hypothetical protein